MDDDIPSAHFKTYYYILYFFFMIILVSINIFAFVHFTRPFFFCLVHVFLFSFHSVFFISFGPHNFTHYLRKKQNRYIVTVYFSKVTAENSSFSSLLFTYTSIFPPFFFVCVDFRTACPFSIQFSPFAKRYRSGRREETMR